ncbi:competence type IV pilus minor pilin ComGG [Virgibacillus alimentarius]|uniref:competence type IV pilus minor pilin ComGG n=1 Tax=Virgibacillus alimentarius TaxID=698769 RepID=UPI0004938885|nr:competence type IV pilus minor pilin ComGG [Virgibacillus alimentarius]
MRKQSAFITNQYGFFLPYVMFITTLVFILVTSSVTIYKNDVQITYKLTEQIKTQTLMQMGYTKFKENVDGLENKTDTIEYMFPDGTVEITYIIKGKQEIQAQFFIKTNNTENQNQYNVTLFKDDKV